MKTEQDFTEAVGSPPENDDMDRVNCPKAGKAFHFGCGWCDSCNLPHFMCSHEIMVPEND